MSLYHLGHLLAVLLTPANERDRTQVEVLAAHIHEVTGNSFDLALPGLAYAGLALTTGAEAHGIKLAAARLPASERAHQGSRPG